MIYCTLQKHNSGPVSYTHLLSAAQEISDVEDLSEYDLDSPQNEIKLTTDDGDTVLQIGMENESTSQYYVKKSDDDKNVYLVDSSAVEPFMGTPVSYTHLDVYKRQR